MNIEEPDPAAALELAGDHLLELHLADSNREGLGSGHVPARELLGRARARGFGSGRTLAVECIAPRTAASASAEAELTDRFLAQCAQVVNEIFQR